MFLFFFRNGHFHNVASTFTNVVKLNVENDNVASRLSSVFHINIEIQNVDSTLFDVVNSNVEKHNVVSALIWSCPVSGSRINQKTTLKQRWNICWVWFLGPNFPGMRGLILLLVPNVCYLAVILIFLVVTWWLLLVT